jgi:sugar phosphate isomerase/epimerase
MAPNRRDALRTLGSGLLAWLAAPACHGGSERFGGFTMAVQSWTFRNFTVDQALEFTARLGVTRVELSPQAYHFGFPATDAQIDAMRAKLAGRGLDCVTSGLEPVTGDAAMNRAVFEYARRLGLRNLMVDAPPEVLATLDDLVAEFDIRIGVHNHGPGTRYSTIEDMRAALDGRERRIGTIVDTGHYTRAGVDPVDAFHAFAGRVYGVHLKDVAAKNPAAPDTILGEGVLDLPGVFRALRDIGLPPDASLSLEYEANPAAPYDDVVTALANADRAASRG